MPGILIDENSFIYVQGVKFFLFHLEKGNYSEVSLEASFFVSVSILVSPLLTHRPLSRFLIVLLIGLRVPTNAP